MEDGEDKEDGGGRAGGAGGVWWTGLGRIGQGGQGGKQSGEAGPKGSRREDEGGGGGAGEEVPNECTFFCEAAPQKRHLSRAIMMTTIYLNRPDIAECQSLEGAHLLVGQGANENLVRKPGLEMPATRIPVRSNMMKKIT